MPAQTIPGRWLLLAGISLSTSVLLTSGIALLGTRDIASADRGPSSTPTVTRPAPVTLLRELGGAAARTPTPALASAPTLALSGEPGRPAARANDPQQASAPAQNPAQAAANLLAGVTSPLDSLLGAAVPAAANAAPSQGRAAPPPTIAPPTATATPTASATPTPAPPTALPTATRAPTNTPAPTPTPTQVIIVDQPPTVSLILSDSRVDVGDSVTITVVGYDDRGLDSVGWSGVEGSDNGFGKDRRAPCSGKTQCSRSWTVTANKGGEQQLVAEATDVNGQRSEQAWATLRIRK